MFRLKSYFKSIITDERKGFKATLIKVFLSFIASGYRVVISLILLIFNLKLLKPKRLSSRVLSVGNITWGGTGKTGCVEMLAQSLKDRGKKVAVLLRGYGRDERYLLAQQLKDVPVFADKNRIRSGQRAIADYAVDTIILDDGFQQWAVARDLDIVLIDATNPFGNYRLIPRGILREPISSLKRADIFLISKVDMIGAEKVKKIKSDLARHNPQALICEAIYQPLNFYRLGTQKEIPLDYINKKDVCVFSAIGDPASFESTVKRLAAGVKLKFRFLDHYFYRNYDLKRIFASCLDENVNLAVTTSKDAVKLSVLGIKAPIEILVLRSKFVITDKENEFFYRLFSLYSR